MRKAEAGDRAFLRDLYGATRGEEMALVDWNEEQKASFLDMQFGAQLTHYEANFPQAQHDIILLDAAPIGRFYVDRSGQELRLLDITLLPQHRNHGIGATLMKGLQEEGADAGKPVRFHVWQLNHDAMRFYCRLGFTQVGEAGAYILMEWPPSSIKRQIDGSN